MGDSLRFVPQTLPHPRVCLTLPPLRMASEQKPAETVPQILLCLLAPFPLHTDREAVGFIKEKKKKQTKKREDYAERKRGCSNFCGYSNRNPKALCNLAYCVFGLLALTRMLLARTSKRAMCCTTNPPRSAARSSWLQPPAQAAPGHRSSPARSSSSSWPYSAAGRLPRTALVLSWQRKAVLGDKRGPKLRGFSSPGGEGGTCQGCTKLLQ